MAQENWWDADPVVSAPAAPAPATGAFPGVILGRPKTPPQDSPAELERLRLAQEEAARQAAKEAKEASDKQTKFNNAQSGAIASLGRVLDKIDTVALDSADNNGWFETGGSGSLMRSYGPAGTAGYDLQKNIDTIDANSAFAKLQEMRDNSPTGGALGSITEKELELLKSTVSNLDPNQSQPQFVQNLAEAKRAYLDMLRRLDPDAAKGYETKPGIRFDENGAPWLTSIEGPDDRERRDPFNVRGKTPPDDSGGGGGDGPSFWEELGLGLKIGTGDLVQGAGDMLGVVTNPLNATVNAATGSRLTTDMGSYLRDDVLGIPHGNRTVEMINRGGMAALSGSLAARGAAGLTNPGAMRGALSTFAASPARDTVGGASAGLGGDIARRNDLGVGGQVAGAMAGGLAGYGAAGALSRAVAPRATMPIAEAAQRQNVDLLPADVGGRGTRIVTSAAQSSPFSASPVETAAARTQEQLRGAADRAARSQAPEATTEAAGQGVRNAAHRYTKATSERGARLYDRAYESAKGVKIKPVQTLAAIDEQLSRLAENPSPDAATAASGLKAFRDNIADGVSVRGLRDARTSLSSGVYDGKLRSGPESAMYKNILSNIADDIDNGLKSVGRDNAAGMFRRADDFWKGRVEHIDEVLQPILGANKGGEEIVQSLEGMARGQRGGNARLSRLLANMTDAEAGQVRAAVVDRLGKATPGRQSADGNAFSASTFLTNWNRMTPQAKASLFSDQTLRRRLDDIAELSEGTKASQALTNTSNTTAAFTGSAMGNMAVGSVPKAILAAGAQAVTGRLMASPGFARILARSAKLPAETARKSVIEQLGVLGSREPLIAADARALQQQLQQSFGSSPASRAAAEEEDKDVRREPIGR